MSNAEQIFHLVGFDYVPSIGYIARERTLQGKDLAQQQAELYKPGSRGAFLINDSY